MKIIIRCMVASMLIGALVAPASAHRRSAPIDPWLLGALGIQPQLEHWPSNYLPDSYRLDDYRGGSAAEGGASQSSRRICRQAHGAHLSTRGTTCSNTREADRPGQHYSTD